MSVHYSDGVILTGQSNMSALLQGMIDQGVNPDVWVAGSSHPGNYLANDTWLTLATPWARSTFYDDDLLRHNGAKYKRLVSVFFQGESDTETSPLAAAHAAKVAAYHEFLAEDLVATDGVLYEVIMLPWDTAVGSGAGYTTVRANLLAYVAESPSTRVALDSQSWGRSGDNVHMTAAQAKAAAPTIIAAVNTFLARAAGSEGVAGSGGGGSGDMLASNNLSELTDVAEARTNLELTSAATTATSSGGNSTSDSGKLALFRTDGSIRSSTSIQVFKNGSLTSFVTLDAEGLTGEREIYFPDAGGTLALEEYVGDYFQPRDADLTALAALSGTNTLYYRSGAGTWSAVTIGSGMSFSGGTLSSTGGGGGGGGSGTVTSVALSGGTTGLTVSGSPITTSGTITLAGTLAVANGGTGSTTASAARTALGLVIGTDVLAPNGSGGSLTALNASAITSGTVPAANLGSGASITTKFLRGDNTWQTISGGGDLLAANNLSDLASAATARTNLGLGDASTKTASAGGNGAADSGKAALFGASGELLSTAALRVNKTGSTTIYATSSAINLTAARAFTWPDSGGIYATQEWVGDFFSPLAGTTGNLVLSSATPDAEGLLTITALGATFKITPLSLTTGAETGSALVLTSATPDAEGLLTLEALGISFKITPLSLT